MKFDWLQLLNPEFYINFSLGNIQLGLWIVLFIVFAETGLFIGFFLPGDSLLFLAGIYANGYDKAGVYHPGLVEQFFPVSNDFVGVTILASLIAFSGRKCSFFGKQFYKCCSFINISSRCRYFR